MTSLPKPWPMLVLWAFWLLPVLPAAALAAQQKIPDAPQKPQVDVTAGQTRPERPQEPAVDGFVRRDRDTLALTLGPDKTLSFGNIDFNGEPVDTSKVHLRQLAPGVFELTSVAYEVGYWRIAILDSAAVYGLGEHFDTLNHAHTVVHNLSMDVNGTKGSSTYKPAPFYLSTTGYGLWLDTTGEATFDLNTANRNEIIVDAATDKLRLVFFTGATDDKAAPPGRFAAILAAFTGLTQRALLPPYWAFAPWLARDYHQNQAQVLEDIDKTRALGLPASVILIDSPWATAYNSYQFNPKQFDDAPAMIRHLHAAGYKLVLWHTPWINLKSDPPREDGFGATADAPARLLEMSPNYKEAADDDFFVRNLDGTPWVGRWWKGEGSLIDFTNQRARHWWQDQVRQAIAAGADGFKDDDAEGAFLGAGKTADPDQIFFADGTDPRIMRNRYANLYNNAMEELIQKDLKGNGVLFARSVTTGANGLGFLWGGDNAASFSPDNGLPTVVTAGLSAGLSGMPLWAADLGGYLQEPDTPNALLLQRWTEYAAFSPLMEVMSGANIVPWTFDRNATDGSTPALNTYKKYAVLHMSLFPYRYAAAQAAAKTGMPILRALVLAYQDDVRARAIKDEYLFGPDLLVAPVIDENTSRVVYLPAGDWLNLATGDAITGPKSFIAKADADQIPVYARRGTILPKIPEDVMTLVPDSESGNTSVPTLDNRRIYEVLGPPSADGATDVLTDFEGRTLTRSGKTLAITGATAFLPFNDKPTHLILRWRFLTPASVTVNGDAVPVKNDADGVPTVEFDQKGTATVRWQ